MNDSVFGRWSRDGKIGMSEFNCIRYDLALGVCIDKRHSVSPTSKCQRQLQASGGGEPLGGAHSVLPAPAASIHRLGTALDNLALTAANDTTVLQQLTSANLALTTSNATLTAANKKLLEALAKVPTTTPCTPGKPRAPNKGKPFPGNYCWTHGHRISQLHTSGTCTNKAEGHKDAATASNTMGGCEADKGWNTRCP
jgi:hypothetical protein